MSKIEMAAGALNEHLEDWRLLLVSGIIVTMVGVAMPFGEIQEAFVELPALVYLAVGLLGTAAGLWQFWSVDTSN